MRPSISASALASNDASRTANVRVCCRVRPQNAKELAIPGAKHSVVVNGSQVEVKTGDGSQVFAFDHVFDEDDGQQIVFDNVARPVVQDIMDGYNATIFAYGQTASGKTFTMEGASIDDPHLRGIIPRTATEIFNNVMAADENMEFIVKVSYIEIYMERIRDLLDPYKSKVNLQVREDAQRGIFVEGMTELSVCSDEELLAAMRSGAASRAVAATGMNEGSSRSHSVFIVTLFQRNLVNQATKAGKLYLVDLAGSEMVRKTGATGKQLEEAKTINKSLSALGNVINALTDPSSLHIPYRDSKLTRVLQESLGGNSKTALIINVSPSSYNTMETLSTLRFGHRAKSIKNMARVNEERSVEEYKAMLSKAERVIRGQRAYILAMEKKLTSMGVDCKSEFESYTKNLEATTPEKQAQQQRRSTANSETIAEESGLVSEADGLEKQPEQPEAFGVLQARVLELEEELTEEKQESTRRAEDIRVLTARLESQVVAVSAAQKESEETRKVHDEQTKSLEDQLRKHEERYVELRGELDRLTFEHQELHIHAEKVQREYEALLHDIASPPPPTSPVATVSSASAPSASSLAGDDTSTLPPPSPIGVLESASAASSSSQSETPASNETKTSAPITTTNSSLSASAGESSEESVDMKARCQTLEDELRHVEKEYRILQINTEREKNRMADELERKTLQLREMEMHIGIAAHNNGGEMGASMMNPNGMTMRERQHMRSIQQKLEQLVAVHRQLLRKYASLELELTEAKKKIALRDERIKQVEANNRLMAGNMRAQAEKHVEELTHLRDQIADFRGAQRSHFEAQMGQSNSGASNMIKALRGGGNTLYSDGVIRPIRGGGRRIPSGEGGATAPSTTGSVQTPSVPSPSSSGFLTRLFGGGNKSS